MCLQGLEGLLSLRGLQGLKAFRDLNGVKGLRNGLIRPLRPYKVIRPSGAL